VALCGGVLASGAILIFVETASVPGHAFWFPFGAACMFGGFFCDAFDGVIARKFHWESELGKHLDSLCDALTYLVAPAVALRALGARGVWPSLALLALIGAGLLRLAYFTMAGTVQTARGPGFLGMPSYYSHFAV